MIHLTQTAVLAESGGIRKLAEEFAETGCARLPGFMDPRLLNPLLNWLESARFQVKNELHEGRVFGTTLFVPSSEPSLFLLHFILNRPALFKEVERVTGCAKLGNFTGRIHRTSIESHHHIDWHDDRVHTRTVGINIGLSTESYTGGMFQLRDAQGRVRAEVGRTAAGDAFLFRIGEGWQHRLTPVESGRRTVAVGWFLLEPDWQQFAKMEFRTRFISGQPEAAGL
jgi:hypothetical protein